MTVDAETLLALEQAALKVLRRSPERFKRERVYQTFCRPGTTLHQPAMVARLRKLLGDTDDDRDTRDEPEAT